MNNRDEQISSLMDDALEQQELDAFMQDLKRDPVDDAERIKRYQVMGDAMRNDLNAVSFMDISAAVQRAIDNEPELEFEPQLAPRRPFNFSAWMRPLSGVAIAASVAMVTVISFRTVETSSDSGTVQTVANVQSAAAPQIITPINPQISQQIQVVSTDRSATPSSITQKQLNDYMMNHSEYAGQISIQGMMPYVRVVSLDAKTRQ